MSVRVAIVEDDVWLAQQYQRVLERSGYESRHASHAAGAMDMIDQFSPEVILLDMLLTGTSALPLLHELRSHEDLSRIPIVLVTNLADDVDHASLQDYGVDRVINKTTMKPDDIIVAIRAVLP